ncbi:polyprenyl diphosphate synthase [Marinimicrobium sp. ABcell2]|uniref:polyprenyl diphosphate synthase n=1 Tax=Marinimicrobium sp. ABcell2 TaxID=3069751 RepID=UPI0027B4CB74|nr:polyprenyl diphosphate synthase [Marinimicrobium sp. ABcell2]MDQ2075328.1 polyprenyl diphosphate synthase [Marinimicrobium sp. ABcell2]
MTSNSLRHIAIIMDGNNRWAKQRKMSGVAGHKVGVERIRDVMSACQELNVEVLTLFAFSSENWKRPPREVEALMSLFLVYLKQESKELRKKGVRLRVIGNRDRFSPNLQKAIAAAEHLTREGDTTLVIAADYGGRWDIAQAARRLAEQVEAGELSAADIDSTHLHRHTALSDLPEPDLLIRTGGEQRISNFLLWQCTYSELYFTKTLWPDFRAADLHAAAADFHRRQRRFGLTGDQLSAEPLHTGLDRQGVRHA